MHIEFHVMGVHHQGGEHLPILLDARRQPIRWISAYAIQRLRARLSSNSLVKSLSALGVGGEVFETLLERLNAARDSCWTRS